MKICPRAQILGKTKTAIKVALRWTERKLKIWRKKARKIMLKGKLSTIRTPRPMVRRVFNPVEALGEDMSFKIAELAMKLIVKLG